MCPFCISVNTIPDKNDNMKIHRYTRTMAIIIAAMTTIVCSHDVIARTFSTVNNPQIPMKMEFAGQSVDLDRTDKMERLDRELSGMIYSHGNTLLTIKRANRFFPIMAPILKKNGVPEDLLYLACIESTLDPKAVSPAKAAGLWQFMPDTGRQYGLEVNEYVDERYHPEKATEAACKYLNAAYKKYGKWESVAASYNAGMGRISSELSKQQVESAYDLYLVNETSRYIYRLLAQKLILENPSEYGYHLTAEQLYQPIETEEVVVNTPVADWQSWAKSHGTNYLILRELNPWIRDRSLPNKMGKTYKVKLPVKDAMKRSLMEYKTYNPAWIK